MTNEPRFKVGDFIYDRRLSNRSPKYQIAFIGTGTRDGKEENCYVLVVTEVKLCMESELEPCT